MPDKFTYLLINLGAFAVPFLFSFHPRLRFVDEWRNFWPACIITASVFVAWDVLYTRLGVWGFNSRYVMGPAFLALPLEELLFFICIPYASVFTYHCLRQLSSNLFQRPVPLISLALIVTCALVGALFVTRLYTGVTFSLLALLLLWLAQIRRVPWLSHFYVTWLIILIPFFLVNGLLTGTGLDEPVVWYNDQENLGLRLLTIPVEDVFYGMLLLLLNTALFEFFRNRTVAKKNTDISL